MPPLILASTSTTRRKLLCDAGVDFKATKPGVDEEALSAANDWSPTEIALRLAEAKAIAVATSQPGTLIIGADQTLLLKGTLVAKPVDQRAARNMLLELRGERHTLQSAVACSCNGKILFRHVEEAHLTMRQFSDQFLDRYIEITSPDVIMSAGGYRVEETGIQLFERIEGDHFVILGLPLLPLLSFLRTAGHIQV
jgi:septum formation protein